MNNNDSLTVEKFLLIFKEFLVVWLNQILYYSKIYPTPTFDQFKAFNLVILINRHPDLSQFINQLFINIINQLIIHKQQSKTNTLSNGLLNINCLIYNVKTNTIIKKFTINFYQFITSLNQTIHSIDDLTSISDNSSKLNIDGLNWNEINTQYNALLFNHIQDLKQSPPTPKDTDELFFRITVDVDKSLYINSDNNNWVRLSGSDDKTTSKSHMKPIGQVDLEILNFNCFNESYE
ncbi:hypothetical protein SBY92_002616 [Candida maltosa Xu316]